MKLHSFQGKKSFIKFLVGWNHNGGSDGSQAGGDEDLPATFQDNPGDNHIKLFMAVIYEFLVIS
jgi:hypothetical protein